MNDYRKKYFMNIRFYLLIIILGLCSLTKAQNLSTEKDIDNFIDEQIKRKKISGAVVLVAKADSVLMHSSYGYQSIENKSKMDTNSIFRIYSMTKPVTSVAALMLIDSGKISLNDPIEKYLPQLKDLKVLKGNKEVPLERSVTIKHLLTHTAGFAYGFGLGLSKVDFMYNKDHPFISSTTDEFLSKLSKYPLKSQPGEKYSYSLSVDVLGVLIEKVSGMTLGEFCKINIFDPLGMRDTYFKLPEVKVGRFCANYGVFLELKDSPEKSDFLKDRLHSGGGGLVSTGSDYLKFCQLLLNKGEYNGIRLLSRVLVETMTENHLPKGEALFKSGGEVGVGFGLGVSVIMQEWGDKGHLGDYSWNGMASTHFFISPSTDLIVIVMSQKMPYSNNLIQNVKPLVYKGL